LDSGIGLGATLRVVVDPGVVVAFGIGGLGFGGSPAGAFRVGTLGTGVFELWFRGEGLSVGLGVVLITFASCELEARDELRVGWRYDGPGLTELVLVDELVTNSDDGLGVVP
jgi:hypothetical protein